MGRHCLLLDEALDEVLKIRLQKARGHTFIGAGFASDESPPTGARFSGYRFQVTYLHVPFFLETEAWEGCDQPPVSVSPFLLDVVHCPGKDGRAITDVLEKQLHIIGHACHETELWGR